MSTTVLAGDYGAPWSSQAAYPDLCHTLEPRADSPRTHCTTPSELWPPPGIIYSVIGKHNYFLEANILSITFLYCECVSSLMYDINNNNKPISTLHFFKENIQHSTRIIHHHPRQDWRCKGVLSLDLG